MARYIELDALVAEIESLLDKGKYHEEYDCAYRDGNNGALYALKGKVNTLEVKEVDLEKELVYYLNDNFIQCNDGTLLSSETGSELTWYDYGCIAKHFFELGLKAQKGEEV